MLFFNFCHMFILQPNKIITIVFAIVISFSLTAVAQQASEQSPVGYDSVEEALQALQSEPGVQMSTHDSWTVAIQQNEASTIVWSFTQEGHDAHPAVIRREFVEQEGLLSIDMKGLCESEEEPCDLLFQQFRLMDKEILQN